MTKRNERNHPTLLESRLRCACLPIRVARAVEARIGRRAKGKLGSVQQPLGDSSKQLLEQLPESRSILQMEIINHQSLQCTEKP